MFDWVKLLIFVFFALLIAIMDFKTQRIPNILLLMLAGAVLIADLIWDLEAIPLRLLTAIGAFGLFYIVYRLKGGLGFGDVKFAGVIGYYLGPYRVIAGLLLAVLFGLIYFGFGHYLFRWGKEKRFPFGPWLAFGAVAARLFHWSLQ